MKTKTHKTQNSNHYLEFILAHDGDEFSLTLKDIFKLGEQLYAVFFQATNPDEQCILKIEGYPNNCEFVDIESDAEWAGVTEYYVNLYK